MQRDYFLALEKYLGTDKRVDLNEMLSELAFNDDGLIPVVVQDQVKKDVLMVAWMNAESIALTLETGKMTYWSRSRQALWVKGETSGNTQQLVSMKIDCDGDTLLCQIHKEGPACHTGNENCFYLQVNRDQSTVSFVCCQ